MDSLSAAYTVRTAQWPADAQALRALRHAVFVAEQGVPEAIEWDGLDEQCLHALAVGPDASAIGCGRLLPDGHIGRMAVLRAWRKQGVGGALLLHLIALARARGHTRVMLNAQTHALDFYRRHGFEPVGPAFMEAGIAHRAMELALA